MEKKEEGNSEMGGSNSLYYSRRCKTRKSLTNIESLPEDVMFNILLLVPAEDIHDNARLVCRKWYSIIHTRNFVNAHFQHTTSGLLIRDKYDWERLFFVAMGRGRIEISKPGYNLENLVWASCDGLILEYDEGKRDTLYIANPVTNQHLALPPFRHERQYLTKYYGVYYGIAYAAASKVYKVVITYTSGSWISEVVQCAILTVGVDNSWRPVDMQHLSHKARKHLDFTAPMITEGFMHWSREYTHFVTMNVETEIITETSFPRVGGEEIERYCFSTGRCLSLLIACSKLLWEVFEMKQETGEWIKLPRIDLEAHKGAIKKFDYKCKRNCRKNRHLVPVGWLKYKEILVLGSFDAFRTFIAYNIGTQEIDSFDLISGRRLCIFNNVHKNSLVWLDG